MSHSTVPSTNNNARAEIAEYGLSATPLDEEQAAVLRQVRLAMQEADADQYDPHSTTSPHVARLDSIVRLLWGKQGEAAVNGDVRNDDEEYTLPDSAGDVQVTSPQFMALSLESQLVTLARAGRATPKEVLRMSAASPTKQRQFIDTMRTTPAHAFSQAAADRETRAAVDAQLRRTGFGSLVRR